MIRKATDVNKSRLIIRLALLHFAKILTRREKPQSNVFLEGNRKNKLIKAFKIVGYKSFD